MGYDLVTWAPRIGASGDDKYNVPGATKLDASVDTSNPTRINAGDSSGFSTIPSIGEINASSDWNQVIGLANRRIRTYNTAWGSSLPALSYFNPGERITASSVNTVINGILALRTLEGFLGTPSYVSNVVANFRVFGWHLAQCRKMLSISGLLAPPISWSNTNSLYRPSLSAAGGRYSRNDNPYGSIVSETISAQTDLAEHSFGGGTYTRRRCIYTYPIPDWCTSISSAYMEIYLTGENRSVTNTTWQLFRSAPTNFSPYVNADFYDTTTLVHAVTSAAGFPGGTLFDDTVSDVSILNSVITSNAGGGVTFLHGFDFDFNDTGLGFTGYRFCNFRYNGRSSSGVRGGLVIDLG